jgi:hypothetical protein
LTGFRHPLNDVRGAERNRRHLAQVRQDERESNTFRARRKQRARERQAAKGAGLR